MLEMVEYVAKALVSNPDAVEVTEEVRGNRTILRLRVEESTRARLSGGVAASRNPSEPCCGSPP